MAFFGAFVREDMARLKAAQPSVDSRDAFASVLDHVRLLTLNPNPKPQLHAYHAR